MGNKRKLLTILISLLILIIISGTVVLVYYNGKDKASDSTSLDNDKSEITRGEWIEVLARSLGMDDFQNDEPYFEDVNRKMIFITMFNHVMNGMYLNLKIRK